MRLRLGGGGEGIVGWALAGIDPATTAIDGLPTAAGVAEAASAPKPHPNGAIGLDHVVVLTPSLDRTAVALAKAGIPLRRLREAGGSRQGFRRLGPAILEAVEASGQDPTGPATFWGLTVVVSDLEALADRLGPRLGAIHPAVQQGRSIATLRESAELGEAVAFMSPAS